MSFEPPTPPPGPTGPPAPPFGLGRREPAAERLDPGTDPTRVTNQPSLTTSTGRMWLVVGGLFTIIAAIVLVALLSLPPHGFAAVSLGVIGLLYVGMIVTQLITQRGRLRLGLLAGLMLAIAAYSLVAVLVLAISQPGVGPK